MSASTIGQAEAAQTVSPISMKLGRFEWVHPKLLQSKFKEMWSITLDTVTVSTGSII